MPILNRSYFDAAQKGRDAAQSEQSNALLNRQRVLDVNQGEYANGLMRDPNTTPEQFIRAGQTGIGNALHNLQPDQAAQAKQFAEQMSLAIKYAKGSKSPKALIEQNFPQLAQQFGHEWQTATDDQVRAELDNAEAKFGVQAGIAPQTRYTQSAGPRGSVVQTNPDTNEQKQVVGPDNSQPGNGAGGPKYRPLTTEEIKSYGLPTGTTAQIDTVTGKVDLINRPTNASVGRPLPPTITKGLVENNSSIRKIDNALAALEKYPQAFGTKNYLGDAIRQRSDPQGVDPRAKVADIGSLIIHDRSGAAVSASEFPRLAPFVPVATDDPATVKTKLANLKANIQMMNEETQQIYSTDQGYKEFNAGPSNAPAATQPTQQPAQIKSDAEYAALPSGAQYIAPDGSTRRKK